MFSPDGDGDPFETIARTYDAAGQTISAADGHSAYTFTYDAGGNLLSVDNDGTPTAPHVVMTNSFDALGHRTGLSTTVDGTVDFTNAYQYDLAGRLTQLTQHGTAGGNTIAPKRVDLAYNADGAYSTITRYADLAGTSTEKVAATDYGYDDAGRLTSLAHVQADATPINSYAYTFDANGRLTSAASNDGTVSYSYDATGQLTDSAGSNGSSVPNESYSYDANGNRTNNGYEIGTDNLLASDGTYDYTYDDEGNRTAGRRTPPAITSITRGITATAFCMPSRSPPTAPRLNPSITPTTCLIIGSPPKPIRPEQACSPPGSRLCMMAETSPSGTRPIWPAAIAL